MTLLEQYDATIGPMVGLIRLILDGQPGATLEARRIMLEGDEPLSGRMFALRSRIEDSCVVVKMRRRA